MAVVSIREKALQIANSQVGVKEVGSNWGPKVAEYLRSAGISFPAAWCMAFVHWCYKQAGLEFQHVNQASVGFFAQWAAHLGYHVNSPTRGDVVAFNFDEDLWPDHVGFVRRAAFGLVYTTEGNTTSGVAGNQADGGGVYQRVRRANNCLFFRVPGDVKYQYEDKRSQRKIYLRSWILRKRKEGWAWSKIKNHPYGVEYYKVLGGK